MKKSKLIPKSFKLHGDTIRKLIELANRYHYGNLSATIRYIIDSEYQAKIEPTAISQNNI